MAFCAVRLKDAPASVRLANEAVGLDSDLFWVYAVVAVRHPELPEISQWLPQLERRYPQNALFPLISAESIDIEHVINASKLSPKEEQQQLEGDPAWQSAMAAAFRSAKFDDYLDRLQELDRRVVLRYHFYDAEEVLFGGEDGIPTYSFWDSSRFASALIRSGQNLEATGDWKGAGEKYWAVAHYGQMIDSQGHAGSEHWAGTSLQAMAYKQLKTLSEKEGSRAESALFGYLTAKLDPAGREQKIGAGAWIFGWDICKRNASVLLIAGLATLIFSGLLVVTAPILIVGSFRAGAGAQNAKPVATFVALISAVGLLLSSSALYLTYRPYWYLFQSAILNGETAQARDLRAFLSSAQMVFGLRLDVTPDQQLFFWESVIVFGVIGLILILLRHLRNHTPADMLQHNSRVL